MQGGDDPLPAQEIGCHFSGNDPNVLKLPDFSKNYPGVKKNQKEVHPIIANIIDSQ